MTIQKDGIVTFVRKQLTAWYENAKTPGRQLSLAWVAQAEGEARKMGCNLPDGSVTLVWLTWCKNHAVFLNRKRRFEKCQSERKAWADAHPLPKSPEGVPLIPNSSIPGDDLKCETELKAEGPKERTCLCRSNLDCPREPFPVLSPEDRMSASIGKALEVVEMFLKFLDVYVKDSPVKVGTDHVLRYCFALSALYMCGLAEKFMKLKLSTFDAIAKNQHKRVGGKDENLPPVKAPFSERAIRCRHVLPGLTGLQLGHFIMENRARAQFFVFWMKKAAPIVGAEMIAEQELATFKVLQVKHDPPPITIDGQVITHREDLAHAVMTYVQALNLPKYSSEAPFGLPSCHASYNMTRAEGGPRAIIPVHQPSKSDFIHMLNESLLTRPDEYYVDYVESKFDPPLSVMTLDHTPFYCGCCAPVPQSRLIDMTSKAIEPRFRQLEDVLPTSRDTLNLCQLENHPLRPGIMSRIGYNANESIGESPPLISWFDQAYQHWAARDVTRHLKTEPVLRASIVGLAEPIKVRPISKGPERAYYKILHVQKFLHSALRRIPQFRLIGQSLTLEDINHTFRDPLKPGEFYVSGDYRSATDLLSSHLSEVCARIIAEVTEMPRDIEELFVNCLVGHTMTLGKEHAPQANGQLMGSPASFPVLCIVNAALSHYARELACGHTVEVGSYPLLINGDDIGFIADQKFYSYWKRITALGGLFFSMGKNFTSEEFLVLNSCMFEVGEIKGHPRVTPPPRVPKSLAAVNLMKENIFAQMPLYRVEQLDFTDPQSDFFHWSALLPPEGEDVQVPILDMYQHWYVTSWRNPDFLGPVGRFLPLDQKDGLFKMACFRRRTIGCSSQLFDVSEYALLPGLQQAWLQGVSDVEERHRLNLIFISSWKPVLALSQGPGFTKDWWLPTHLGGLGLENTDPNRTIESSSRASRCLAKYLSLNPQDSPILMPTISFEDDLQSQVSIWMTSLPSDIVPRDSQTPNGWMDHSDVLGHLMRTAWMDTFGTYRDSEHSFAKGMKQIAFESKMKELNKRLTHLWHHKGTRKGGWKTYQPISEADLAVSLPHRKIYRFSAPGRFISEHGLDVRSMSQILPHPKDECGLSVRFQDPRPFISWTSDLLGDSSEIVEPDGLATASASCADVVSLSD